jgi:hypothetical protein
MSLHITPFKKVVAVVAIILLLPSILASFTVPVCEVPNCPDECTQGTHDCTEWWVLQSPENFALAFFLTLLGYTILVCCQD